MTTERTRLSVEEFATDIDRFLEQLDQPGREIVLEGAGREFVVRSRWVRADRRRREWKPTEADLAAFLDSAGGWQDLIDPEEFKAHLAESRRLSTRPRPEL